MDTQHIELDRARALELYRQYKKHAHYSRPIDRECMRAYQLLAKGRLVIRALESVRAAGIKTAGTDVGFPKLALCRADATSCKVSLSHDGSADMHAGDVEREAEIERLTAVIVRAKDALLDGQSTQWVHDLLVAALKDTTP